MAYQVLQMNLPCMNKTKIEFEIIKLGVGIQSESNWRPCQYLCEFPIQGGVSTRHKELHDRINLVDRAADRATLVISPTAIASESFITLEMTIRTA